MRSKSTESLKVKKGNKMLIRKLKLHLILPAIFACAFFALTGHAQAATYYVDSAAGNDSWTGTAGAYTSGSTGPWRTIAKVNSFAFQSGDDVYFKCGGVWNLNQESANLTIDWSGTGESNRVIAGAYYLNGASPVIGVSGIKPKLTGNYIYPASFGYLVRVQNNQNFITVQDLEIEGSKKGEGFRADSGSSHITIQRCDIHRIWGTAIVFYESAYGLIDSCDVYDFVKERCGSNGICKEANDPEEMSTGFGGGTIFRRNCHNSAIRNSKVHEGNGEAIHVAEKSNNCTVENNTVYDTALGIFQWGGSDYLTIKNNLVYWSSNNQYWWQWVDGVGWRPGHAIYLDDEWMWTGYSGMDHVYVYNNLIGRSYSGISFGTSMENNPLDNIHIVNNTFVQNERFIRSGFFDRYGSCNALTGSSMKNNVFYCPEGSCTRLLSDGCRFGGLAFDHNFWSGNTPAISGTVGAHDVVGASAPIQKSSGWHSILPGNLSSADFKLLSNSPAIDKGFSMGSPYNLDFFGATRPQGSAWDIGAHEYGASGGDTTAPGAPGGLSVR
jgi:parallel beta-helix repeat protein